MLLALICVASVAAFNSTAESQQHLKTSGENRKDTQEHSLCREQNWPATPKLRGVLYFVPPEAEVLEKHKWLKFTINTPLSEGEVRMRIWPNPRTESKEQEFQENCRTSDHEQELFGKMNQTTTFVLSTKQYLEGACLQVEIEDEHRRWSKVKETMCEDYDVTFEGNGDDAEMNVAVAFVFVAFIGFSLAFLQLWFCLLKTGRFM